MPFSQITPPYNQIDYLSLFMIYLIFFWNSLKKAAEFLSSIYTVPSLARPRAHSFCNPWALQWIMWLLSFVATLAS